MIVVPDASVVVKWYIPERDHAAARDLRDDFLNGVHDLVAPELLPFEVLNALRYSGFFDDERLVEAADSLAAYRLELRSFGESGPVATVAQALGSTVYDAAYVALADDVDGRAVTADETLMDTVVDTDYEGRLEHVADSR